VLRCGARHSSSTATSTNIPYSGDDATGLGKPLKLLVRPLRASIPIYLAALSPKNVSTAFEIADGWLPIYFSPERARDAFGYEHATASTSRRP